MESALILASSPEAAPCRQNQWLRSQAQMKEGIQIDITIKRSIVHGSNLMDLQAMLTPTKIDIDDFRSAAMLYLPKEMSVVCIFDIVLIIVISSQSGILTVLPLTLIMLSIFPLKAFALTSKLKREPLFRDKVSFSWDGTGLTISSQAGHWTHLWADMRGYLESQKTIVYLLKNNRGFAFIPVRAFSDADQLQTLREVMAAVQLKKLRLFP